MKTIIFFSIFSVFCLNIYGQTAEEYYNQGNLKFQLEDYKGAIADFTKAIELSPNNSDAYYNRGLAKIFFNQQESGFLDLSKAGELVHATAYEAIKKYCN